MNRQPSSDQVEARLEAAAHSFHYPPTPDLAGAVRQRLHARQQPRPLLLQRRLILALTAILIVAVGLLAVPEVRAALRTLFRIGAVELVEPPPSSTAPRSTSTAIPTSLLDLAGETTLQEARATVDFSINLPSYPPDQGLPDHVYVQDLAGTAVILVWLDPQNPDQVELSLHILSDDTFAQKIVGERLVEETTVNGQRALWVRGEHILQFRDRDGRLNYGTRRLIDGHVLIWQQDDLTYRLETDLPLDEARRIAESVE